MWLWKRFERSVVDHLLRYLGGRRICPVLGPSRDPV
jgi:hypothetical protein